MLAVTDVGGFLRGDVHTQIVTDNGKRPFGGGGFTSESYAVTK